VNLTDRSGSNDLHADVFGKYRNDPSDRLSPPRNETDNRVSLPARVGESPSVWSMKAGRAWLLALGLLAVAWPGLSQTTGSIEGRVLDAGSSPVAGALVTVRSPSLQGTRTATSDNNGRFVIQGLPPGNYAARAEFSDLPPVEQTGVPVAVDSSRTLELRILPRFRETVEVAGTPPILDATSSATTTALERTVFKELPTSRTFLDLSSLAPGVVNALATGYPSINGAGLAENRYLVDGLDVTDPGRGTLESTLPVDFLEEVDIKTGGFGPEYGGALGGILNVVTRSGSNKLHGSVFGFYKNDGLASDPPANVRNVRLLGTRDYEAGGTLGGRILGDRLWYFVGIDPTFGHEDWTTQQALNVTNQNDVFYYMGKLTGQLLPGHQLVFSAFGDPTENVAHALNAAGILQNTSKARQNNLLLSYNGLAGRAIWLEALAGRLWQKSTTEPAADGPFYLDGAGGQFAKAQDCGDADLLTNFVLFAPGCLGGTNREDHSLSSRDQVRVAGTASWKTGRLDHELKLGGGWRRSKYETTLHFPGPAPGPFLDRDGNVLNPRGVAGQLWVLLPNRTYVIDFDLDSQSESTEGSLFLQDRIQLLGNLTLDLGVRADSFQSTGDLTAADPTLQMKFGFGDMVAPRLGVAWDPVGNGRSRIFARYDRSYESVPLQLNRFAFAFDYSYKYTFEYPEDGSLPSASNLGKSKPAPCFGHPGELLVACPIGGSVVHVDPNLRPQYSDQFALGVEYQIGSEISLGLTGIYNTVGNAIDVTAGGFLGNPGGLIGADPVTGEVLETPVLIPELVRHYRALQLVFQKRLRDNWQLSGSYVYSRLEGNYGGTTQDNTQFIDPNLTYAFTDPNALENAVGPLPDDRTHQAKLYGSYQWSFGLTSGLVTQYLSGTPISKMGSGGGRFITSRGSAGRTPNLFTLDFHLGYTLPIGKALSVSLFGDLFNVTNAQRAVGVDQVWTYAAAGSTPNPDECGGPGTGKGTDCPAGNPNWGGPVTFQDPRTLRLGIRLSW
jgi:outer membrane receptor protein involved in Fe transport